MESKLFETIYSNLKKRVDWCDTNLGPIKSKTDLENLSLKNYQAILFALNLTFKEWVQLFTYKKSIDDIIQYNKESENIIEEIEINMIHVESLLKKIMEENDEHFLSIFTFFLYNYEEWFLNKQERKRNYKNIIK